jgi:hypothetical protein
LLAGAVSAPRLRANGARSLSPLELARNVLKVPIAITGVLAAIAAAAGFYVACSSSLVLTHSELIQAEIGIFATFGALVSAAFVIYSYIQTNRAFIESQRPQLLIQVENKRPRKNKETSEEVPATFINYKNITVNQFADLTINVSVVVEHRTIDLSDLFRPRMVMIGYDQRQRWFEPLKMLKERGLDLNDVTATGHEALLKLSYSYTYGGQTNTVPCQEYKWDPRLEQWIIA